MGFKSGSHNGIPGSKSSIPGTSFVSPAYDRRKLCYLVGTKRQHQAKWRVLRSGNDRPQDLHISHFFLISPPNIGLEKHSR